MRTVLTISWVELRRFVADRSNIFFVFIFPLAMVAVIGWQFGTGGSSAGSVSVAAPEGSARTALVEEWRAAELEVSVDDSAESVRQDIARGRAQVGVLVSERAAGQFEAGAPMDLELVQGSDAQAPATAQLVRSRTQSLVGQNAQVMSLVEAVGVDEASARSALSDAEQRVPGPTLLVREPTDELARQFDGAGQFDVGASGQLLLFVFLSTLSASAALIKARRAGVIRRVVAAPVTPLQAMLGLTVGRVLIALLQGAYIMLASALLFGVDWGDLRVSLLVLLVFAAIAAGAAMVLGVLVDGEGAASGLAVGLGLVLATLGGCMLPLEIFPERLRAIAHVTPHAWAYDAMAELVRRDGGLGDVLTELGVLTLMAAVVLALGSVLLRRSLERSM